LFGYARIPDRQRFIDQSGTEEPSSFATVLLDELRADTDPHFLVGMGDNLAPDLLSRTFDLSGVSVSQCGTDRPIPPSVHVPKDFFRYDAESGSWRSVCSSFAVRAPFFDNAAEFFVRAGYDAVVPGKHDFYLGAQHLRDVAGFLESHHVHMLGENIIISTTRAAAVMDAHPPLPKRLQQLPYSSDWGASAVDLPSAVLPWKKQFIVRNARRPLHRVTRRPFRADEIGHLATGDASFEDVHHWDQTFVCPTGAAENEPPAQSACMRIRPARDLCVQPLPAHLASSCKALYGVEGAYSREKDTASPDLTFLWESPSGALKSGTRNLLCTDMSGSKPVCEAFTVQRPFFSDAPLAVVSHGSERVAILGVVDPDLLANVGMLNASWLNTHKSFDTSTAVIAPDSAIEQTLELCNSDEACRALPKLLLAQMSQARASQLLAHFGSEIDVVISEADPSHPPMISNVEVNESEPRFVLTPPVPFTNSQRTPRLKTAVFSARVQKIAPGSWKLDNRGLKQVGPAEISASSDASTYCDVGDASCRDIHNFASHALQRELDAVKQQEEGKAFALPSSGSSFQEWVLSVMRDRLDTDVALLQERDFYNLDLFSRESLPQNGLQDVISRVLWKGDFVSTLHITGATLLGLLKQSAAFAASDRDTLATEVEHGRSLVVLGVTQDPEDPSIYYVNGSRLDLAALYTVAATDFLAAGDTGYGALATPDVPPPLRPRTFEKGPIVLAGLVCERLAPYASAGSPPACFDSELGSDYLDRNSSRPITETAEFTTAKHYEALLGGYYFEKISSLGSKTEDSVQQRRFWSFGLENLDFGESGVFINHVIRTTQLLAGISTPGIAQYNTSNIASDHRARLTLNVRKGTVYLLSDSSFLSTRTAPGSLSISTNMLGSEAGGTIRAFGHRPSWLALQYSVRYERELASPPDSLAVFSLPASALPAGAVAEPELFLPTPRTSVLYGRVGLRAEQKDTFFEAGIEKIDARGLLQSYRFDGLPAPVYCEPAASANYLCGPDPHSNSALDNIPFGSDASLASSGIRPTANTTNFLNTGVYLNFRVKAPILSRQDASGADRSIYFTLANKGDLYFNSSHDTPVQTRYLTQVTPALLIPIWGNFSLSPKVDIILFENKVNFFHYRAIQPSVSLSYSFRVREGMAWRRALGFGAQTTAPNTPGSLP
jgi:hypothetical protein